MRVPGIGSLVRSTRTGDIFTVKMTKDDRVLLQSLDGAVTVLRGRAAVELFYAELRDQRRCGRAAQKIPADNETGE